MNLGYVYDAFHFERNSGSLNRASVFSSWLPNISTASGLYSRAENCCRYAGSPWREFPAFGGRSHTNQTEEYSQEFSIRIFDPSGPSRQNGDFSFHFPYKTIGPRSLLVASAKYRIPAAFSTEGYDQVTLGTSVIFA